MMALLLLIAMVTYQSVNYVNLVGHTPFKLSQLAFRQFYLANTTEFQAIRNVLIYPHSCAKYALNEYIYTATFLNLNFQNAWQ